MFSRIVYTRLAGFIQETYISSPVVDFELVKVAECEVSKDHVANLCKAALMERGTLHVGHLGVLVVNQSLKLNGELHYDLILRICDFDNVTSDGITNMVGMFANYRHGVVFTSGYGSPEVHVTLSAIGRE